MGHVVYLVPGPISQETIDAFARWCDDVKRGDIVGAAVLLRHPGGDWTIDIVGICADDPIFTRGMLAKLDDELAALPPRTRP